MARQIGETLRLRREKINLSIEEISFNTKISKRILKKIEESDFSNISSFQKKYFIKNYAKFIGIDNKIQSTEIYNEGDLLVKEKNFGEGDYSTTILDYLFPYILIPTLIVSTFIIIFFSYDRNNDNYLEKLTAIDNKLSGDLYKKEVNDSPLINDLLFDNVQTADTKVESASAEDIFVERIPNDVLFLNFNDEVWIEIENDQEILISRVFQKNDKISLEVIKNDNVFITSGNLGSITIKTNHSEEKALGLNGEIGRKKLF
tara:strand:- start:3201 stop:3980 length:780 start_codon:yes stop_codon:yes gene_type:complete